MNKITVWTLKTKIIEKDSAGNAVESFVWLHNHIEDGHIEADKPTVKFPEQNGWKGGTWRKEFAHLDDHNKIMK